MNHRGRLLEVLKRAETGPMIDEKDFERKLVAQTAKRLVKDYGIQFDGQTIIHADDDLADRLFQAGMDFAIEVGMYCQDTARRITWTRTEYEDSLRHCPSEVVMGMGRDAVTVRARVPEDSIRPAASGGPVGVVFPEEMFVPVMAAYAREPVIDLLEPAIIETAHGWEIKAASPWEVVGSWREAELCMEVLHQVGRQGMCLACVTLSSTSTGHISAASYGGFRPSDWHHCSVLSELKTNYSLLSKVAHAAFIGGNIESYLNPIFGGYFGGPEGVAIGLTAGMILLQQNYMGTTMSVSTAHPTMHCGSTSALLWAQSLAFQAVSRNTNMIIASMNKPAGGPGNYSVLYENAAMALTNSVSGLSVVESSMSASGINYKHASPLESKLSAEVAKAAAGMSRGKADEIVRRLLAHYEPGLQAGPIGQPFDEVYNISTLQPTSEWLGMYEEVKEELVGMGLPLDRLR
jgi:methylamine---corrinoid protein Co-methyltransferase